MQTKDLTLISGSQVNGVTTIVFSRALDTCDDDDMAITQGTSRVLYAYNPNDPDIDNVDATLTVHTVKGYI